MDVKAFDLAFFRSVVQVAVAVPIIPLLGEKYCNLTRDSRKPMFFRGFAGALDYPLLCLAMMFLPVTITAIIIGTSPFWASMIAYFVLGDQVRLIEKVAMVGSFIGIILITIAGSNEHDDSSPDDATFG
mmetsp:Transcript_34836/g.46967  ORF Transcript_34836/g.46967 Transcript_34836/m.46967 type:complete len:129 (-) Transcript_34836:561-947(-)